MRNSFLNKLLIVAAVLFTSSCNKDFLTETLTTARTTDFFLTDAGLQQLSVGAQYQIFDVPFNGEWNYAANQYGTDEFHIGGDPSNAPWNNYDATFGPTVVASNGNTALSNYQWDALYTGVGDANLLIQNASKSTSTAAGVKVALGEGYFLRAYTYLKLVSQYGAVPLQLTPVNSVVTEFTRSAPKDVYDQIVKDFTAAIPLLPVSGGPSHITQDAANHFLAKAYLSRASEINSSWNSSTKTADLAAAVTLCDQVIARHPLAPDFGSLWNFTAQNSANENLSELILSAQFTNDVNTLQGNGNTQHLYFVSRYDIQDQMARDLTGDRPFSRMATTYYTYRLYDMVNDSRFWKSFRTKSSVNKSGPAAPWAQGDLGIMFVINQPGDTRFGLSKIAKSSPGFTSLVTDTRGTGKTIPTTYVAYPNGRTTDGALNTDLTTAGQSYPSLSKHIDGSRNSLNDVVGHRDFNLARSAETYLIAAEAKIRLAQAGTGSYADALPYINAVRNRAKYASGEARDKYWDGGNTLLSAGLQSPGVGNSFYAGNSYYESNNIATTTAAAASLSVSDVAALPAQDEFIISTLGLSSTYDRMLCFVLNERSRELTGEFKRWEDLSRTKTLVARVKAFNPEGAANVKDYHVLRPIPQTFLDGIQSAGASLTPAQKSAMQNPGY